MRWSNLLVKAWTIELTLFASVERGGSIGAFWHANREEWRRCRRPFKEVDDGTGRPVIQAIQVMVLTEFEATLAPLRGRTILSKQDSFIGIAELLS